MAQAPTNVEWFTGLAAAYHKFRPPPPPDLVQVVHTWAGLKNPGRVVDLGSGTGLSASYWAQAAPEVIGIEPNAEMYRFSISQNSLENVSFRHAFAHETGLNRSCAQIVSCFQSLHWMEPGSTLAEVNRILQVGGVFVAADYDWPPVFGHWQIDEAWHACMDMAKKTASASGVDCNIRQWNQKGHLERIKNSGLFRSTKELTLNHFSIGDADRVVGAFLTQGVVAAVIRAGMRQEDLGLDRLRAALLEHNGSRSRRWHWSCRVRIALR